VCQGADEVGTADDADNPALPQDGHALDAVLLQQTRDLGTGVWSSTVTTSRVITSRANRSPERM
jgi:hypothetical protein